MPSGCTFWFQLQHLQEPGDPSLIFTAYLETQASMQTVVATVLQIVFSKGLLPSYYL